jgi:alpha-1,6-mannosyltransferase
MVTPRPRAGDGSRMTLHVVDITMFHAPSSGGVRTYLEAKARWLASARPDIRYSLLVPETGMGAGDPSVHSLPAPPLPFSNGYRFPLRRRAWVEKLIELKPDLIEAQDPYVTGWAALEAGRRLGVPTIAYFHSDLTRLIGSRVGHWADRGLNRYVARLYRQFDRVLAPSRTMGDKLERLGLRNVVVQPLGVDLQRFHPARRDARLRERMGFADDARLLIFAGRGSHEKKIPVLLQAMQRLGPSYQLLLVGSHMPRRVPGNVRVIDHFVPKDELAGLFAASDALAHAGDRETFGLIVLEAMASGLPVIGTDAGAVSELVTPECGRLARAGDAGAFADAVREVFANDPQALGREGRRRAETLFGWNSVMGRLIGHYESLTRRVAMEARHAAVTG